MANDCEVHEMIYKTLGKTGLKVSILGYGASPLGNEFGTADPEEGKRAVHYAIERGVNYFDVSPYYGRTLAETRLGEALRGRRDEVLLATKAGRYDKAVSYTHLTLPTNVQQCRSRWSPDH